MSAPLRVMSFNIRNAKAPDGPNHWELRRELVPRTVLRHDVDVLGTQETLDPQVEYLKRELPRYGYVGLNREPGGCSGEHCGIFFRRERLEKLDEGHFWLSETPEQPGSKSWDASLPRIVSWVKLADRGNANRSFFFFNTHFDHKGEVSRMRSARLLGARAQKIAGPDGLVVLGDFNCGENSEPYRILVGGEAGGPGLRDSLREVRPRRAEHEGTFHAWTARQDGPRIDWILMGGPLSCEDAKIVRTAFRGRCPSDHFPVVARIRFD